jgi:predicted acylesterase/phospholipase RssA
MGINDSLHEYGHALRLKDNKVNNLGFVASGGGYRSFYTAGVLVWLKQHNIPITHISSTSSGNNIVLDYLMWDWEHEALPPTLTQTFRLNLRDIFNVLSNFSGLQPALIPSGTHLFTVNKESCRRSLLLNDPSRRRCLINNLSATRWDILATNITKKRSEFFHINEILSELTRDSLDTFMDIFLAGITTIPYFKAIKIGEDYYLEGGYTDNTPLRTLFENPAIDEIVAVDFTNYNYHAKIDELYKNHPITFALNGIEMNLLVSDLQLSMPNIKIFSQAAFINNLLLALDKRSLNIDGRTYYYKPLHILRPSNLESMTISLEHSSIQKEYFDLGQKEVETLFKEKEKTYGLKALE